MIQFHYIGKLLIKCTVIGLILLGTCSCNESISMPNGYYLEDTGDIDPIYVLRKRGDTDRLGGLLDGRITHYAYNSKYLLVHLKPWGNSSIGWYLIDTVSQSQQGPVPLEVALKVIGLNESEILDISKSNRVD